MKLLLYNIRYGTGTGWKFHFPLPFSGYLRRTNEKFNELVEFVKDVNPDIIGLLEVDSGSFRSGKESQVEVLADELKHYYIYRSKYSRESIWQMIPLVNKQGNAFLTNQEIKMNRFHYFRKGIKRLMIELEFDDFNIFLVHLSVMSKHRKEQMGDIYHHVRSVRKPVIVAGDFNSLWGTHEIEALLQSTGLRNANEKGLPSHPSRYPVREIDFILHSPEISIHSFQMPRVQFSDHMPLICDFEVRR